jgi:hypothetical protein
MIDFDLTPFLTHDSNDVRKAAERIQQVNDDYDAGKITRVELEELCRDSLSVDYVNDIMHTAHQRQQAEEAI